MDNTTKFANDFADQLDEHAGKYETQASASALEHNLARSEVLKECSMIFRIIGQEARRAASIHK